MRKILVFTVFLLFIVQLKAQQQEVVATSGGFQQIEAGSIDWSLGEIMTETATDGENFLTQGFQQAQLQIEAIDENSGFECNVSVYPNPTSDVIRLEMMKNNGSFYQLYTIDGELIEKESIQNEITVIPFNELETGNYLLKVVTNKSKTKTFKIIKL